MGTFVCCSNYTINKSAQIFWYCLCHIRILSLFWDTDPPLRQWFAYNLAMAACMNMRGASFKNISVGKFNDIKMEYLDFLLGTKHAVNYELQTWITCELCLQLLWWGEYLLRQFLLNSTIGCCRIDMWRNMMSPMLCGNTKPLAIQDATYFGMPVADMQN